MKTRILTSFICLAAFAGHAQSPYPSPGPTPLARGARLNASGSMMFGAADLATYTPDAFRHSTDTDDTVALQAAINAACAAAPAKVLLTRVYNISGGITGTVPAGNGITIEGHNRNCGIVTSLATGDVFNFTPSGTPSISSLTTGLRWMTFKDFFVDTSVTRTSGAAFHVQWSDSTSFDNVRIGTFNGTLPGTQLAMYDGIFMDKQSNCSVTHPQIYCSHVGFTTTGVAGSGATANFSFGGYIGGGGYMYGNYATPSIGIHIAGCNGGFELGDFDCGQWGRYALLCDEALASGTNHELFIGRCFLDSAQICDCYIGSNSLNILRFNNGWMAGAGIQTGATTDGSREFGSGLYIQAPQGTLTANLNSSHLYANAGDGVCVGDCQSLLCVGADIYYNGIGPVLGYAGANHGIEIQGGNNVLIQSCDLRSNAGASFLTRLPDGGSYGGVNSYLIFGNDGGLSGYPQGIEENASARTPNQYAGFTLGGAANISDGPFPAQFTLPYNETPTTAGVSNGFYTTPRTLWSTGTTSQGWEFDNNAGTGRMSQNGITYEQFTSSAITATNGASIGVNSPGTLSEQGARAVTYSTQTLSGTNIDWTTKGPFTATLAANTTYTFSGQQNGQTIDVYVTNTGSYTVTWPTVKWPGGAAPTQTTGAHTDKYTFRFLGSTIYGSATQNY